MVPRVLPNLVAGIEDRKLMKRESPGMLTIIKASLLALALMLLESCTGYLTSLALLWQIFRGHGIPKSLFL